MNLNLVRRVQLQQKLHLTRLAPRRQVVGKKELERDVNQGGVCGVNVRAKQGVKEGDKC